MLSIMMGARNGPEMTAGSLRAALASVRAARLEDRVEFVLLDDESDPSQGIPVIFSEFRGQTSAPVSITRFRVRQHYTRMFAYGMSRASKGNNILFVANDMRLTPAFLRTALAVAALDPKIGVVRGCSPSCDCLDEHERIPDRPLNGDDEERVFAEQVAGEEGLRYVEDRILTVDAALIKRELIERIGVFDRQYYGYFGDPDYGIRAQRAGFRCVTAKGAWMMHEAAGYVKEDARIRGLTPRQAMTERMTIVREAYLLFRAKWDPSLPPVYPGATNLPIDRLVALKRFNGMMYESPIGVEPHIAEAL